MNHPPPLPGCGCKPPSPPSRQASGYLMQQILGSGQIHRRCQCYTLSLCSLPCDAEAPFLLTNAAIAGQPTWQEVPCHEQDAIVLRVQLPLCLSLQDRYGRPIRIQDQMEEQLRLHIHRPDHPSWQGQVMLQAAVRLCRPARACREGPVEAALEVLIQAYLVSYCPVSVPAPCPRPEQKPWYPQPHPYCPD
ncbi:MAG: hypothetical protein E7324_08030 [Clostridiales bacterium]|nr:hypothetical protein [Clostridiales bacterium]